MDYPIIKVSDILPGMILGVSGQSTLSAGIKLFDRIKYGKNAATAKISHNAFCDKDASGNLVIWEEAMPGKFRMSLASDDYFNNQDTDEIYVGVPIKDITYNLPLLRQKAEQLGESTSLLDYSYSSYLSFMADAITYRLFGKDTWITGEPNGSTCSQIVIKLYQECFGMFMQKEWWKWFPCETFLSPEIKVFKVVY